MITRRLAGVVVWEGNHIAIGARSTTSLVVVGIIVVLLLGGALALAIFFLFETFFLRLAQFADGLDVEKVQIIREHIPNHFGVAFL